MLPFAIRSSMHIQGGKVFEAATVGNYPSQGGGLFYIGKAPLIKVHIRQGQKKIRETTIWICRRK